PCCLLASSAYGDPRYLHSFPTRRSSDLRAPSIATGKRRACRHKAVRSAPALGARRGAGSDPGQWPDRPCRPHRLHHMATVLARRSEEHTSELQSLAYLVCRLLLEKKKNK